MAFGVALAVLVLLAVAVFYLVYQYGNVRTMNKVTLLVVFIGWYFPFSIIFVMPLDVISAQYHECLNQTLAEPTPDGPATVACVEPVAYTPPEFLSAFWQANYWTVFMLCWAVAPLLQSYSLSGGFTFMQKAWDAVKENIILYAIMGVVGAIGVVYIAVASQLDMDSLLGLLMAVANAYGLFLMLPFVGYGLVNIPRTLWYKANRDVALRYNQFKAPLYRDDYDEACSILREVMREVAAVSEQVPFGHKLRTYVDTIYTKCGEDAPPAGEHGDTTQQEVNLSTLRKLHYRVMAAVNRRNRCRTQWQRLIIRSFHLQDIEKNRDNSSHFFIRAWKQANNNGTTAQYLATMQWWWYVRIEPWVFRVLAVGACVLSIFIVWSECTFAVTEPHLSVFYYLLNFQGIDSLGITVVTVGTLSYMCACAYTSLLRLRIFNYFYIVSGHETDENSLLFCAAMLGRLTFPLCYNFLFLLQNRNTVFFKVMGEIDFLPLLGIGFNVYMPIILAVIVVLVLFHVFERILGWFSIKVFRYDQSFDDGSIEEGREMLEKVRERTERNPIARANELDLERGGNANNRVSAIAARNTSRVAKTTSTAKASANEYHDDPELPPPATSGRAKSSSSRFSGWFGRGNNSVDPQSDTAPLRPSEGAPSSAGSSGSNAFVRQADSRRSAPVDDDDPLDTQLAALQLDSINLFASSGRGGRKPARDMFADI